MKKRATFDFPRPLRVVCAGTKCAQCRRIMPQYVISSQQVVREEVEECRRPLREQVQRCLEQWDVCSSSSSDSDSFCGWRVGSRALGPQQPKASTTEERSARRKKAQPEATASDTFLAARVAALRATSSRSDAKSEQKLERS